MGTVGDCDNALAETVIGLYKTEVVSHLGPWETIRGVEAATGQWAGWYNTRRLMGPTGNRPPAEYEQAWHDGTLDQEEQEGGGHGRRSLPAGGLRPHPPGLRPGPRPSSEIGTVANAVVIVWSSSSAIAGQPPGRVAFQSARYQPLTAGEGLLEERG